MATLMRSDTPTPPPADQSGGGHAVSTMAAVGAWGPCATIAGVSRAWRRHSVALGWGRLSVQIAGDGPPLLLLHGLGGSGRYWAGLAPRLAASHTLIAPDLAGFGRSDKPSVDYSRAFHLDNLDGMLRFLSIDGALGVAGHSMGGILAALFAARRPGRIESLALVASPFPRVQRHPYRTPRGPLARAVYASIQRILPVASPLVRSKTFPRAVVADYLRHTLDSYNLTSNSLLWDPAAVPELSHLGAEMAGRPQLLLYSGEDRTIAPDSLERWRALLPDAEVRVAAGAHQLLLRDRFTTLAGWFEGLSVPLPVAASG